MPNWDHLVRERLRPLNLTGAGESDLAEELARHLEDFHRELLSSGANEEEADRATLAELDDMYPLEAGVKASQRIPKRDPVILADGRRGNLVEDFWRDLSYAGRTMWKSPLFVLFVVVTLGLGIGANTTVFTIINTLLLHPLPVERPSDLAGVAVAETKATSKASAPLPLSFLDLKDYQLRNRAFSSLAGYSSPRILTWQTNAEAQRMFGELVTGNYFQTLGLAPKMGRFFLPEEETTPGAHPVVVLNYGTWQSRFGAAPGLIGKTIRLNNVVFTVIGVAPPNFIGVNALFGPDVWVPASMAEQLLPNEMQGALSDRAKAVFQAVGRLKPGIKEPEAQANMTTLAAGLAREYPAADEGHTVTVRPIRDVLFASASSGTNTILFASAGLLLVVGVVLLIACSNVANLLLARAAARQQEMAVRLALGASRHRLIRQLLTESVLLGLMSGVLGFLMSYGGLHAIFGTLPGSSNFVTPRLDGTVFLYTLLISLATAFLFGTVPAFKASGSSVADALKEEARTTGKSRRRVTIANALLVSQVAFSFLLLATAALFLRSIGRAYQIDPGFQTAHLALFITNPGQAGLNQAQTKAFYKDVRERLMRMNEVSSVSWSTNQPLWARGVSGLQVEGQQPRSLADRITTITNTVDLGYFETIGVPIDRGRDFSNIDQETSTPVAIINEKMARDYWPGENAVGKRIQLATEHQMRQIVGVARTANYTSWAEPPQPCVYIPLEQNFSDGMTLYVRSKGDPRQVLTPVQRELHAAGPRVLESMVRTGSEVIDGALFQAKAGVGLLSLFGLLALALASIGLYGILSYSVNQRRREIGLRMALGAAQASVLKLILKQGMSLVLIGIGLGLTASVLVGKALERMLYGIGAIDPASVLGAAGVLILISLLACYLPARWASKVDPLIALREG